MLSTENAVAAGALLVLAGRGEGGVRGRVRRAPAPAAGVGDAVAAQPRPHQPRQHLLVHVGPQHLVLAGQHRHRVLHITFN